MSVSASRQITYSPAYTIVPTYECFNRCTYCNFRTDPGKSSWLTLADGENLLKSLQNTGVCEILILSGEVHPHSPWRKPWFDRIYNLCKLALSLGFLPHTNVGPLSFAEMAQLKTVNVSMGLMLEQLTPALLNTVHKNAPSKLPELRLKQLEFAGQLKIPFTTGLLLGIGESSSDWWESLEAIAKIHQRWRNIQEIILQPYSPGTQQTGQFPAFDTHLLPKIITQAKQILPPEITIQIPPNLVQEPKLLLACLDAGARDLGGIGPKDEVNPDYPHPHYQKLTQIFRPAGWELVPRLPVYSQYDDWLFGELKISVKRWRNSIQSIDFNSASSVIL
jgi:FO synthase subunit 1